MHRLPRAALLAATVAIIGGLSLPVAAHADTIYPPSGSCSVTPSTTTAGGEVRFTCAPRTFSASESVTLTVTGEDGAAARVGLVRTAISTASGQTLSQGDGSIAATAITLPENASGTYNIAAISETSAGGTATITVTSADGGLATTGIDSGTTFALWISGATLVAAGATLVTAIVVRRRHRSA